MGGQLSFNHRSTFTRVSGKMRKEGKTIPSAGVTSGRGLPPGVFHRLGSLRIRKTCRTGKSRHRSHGENLRAECENENGHRSTWGRRWGIDPGHRARAGKFGKSPTKFLLELWRLYSKKLLGSPWGGCGRVGCCCTQPRLVCRFISKREHQSWSWRFQRTINEAGFQPSLGVCGAEY